jgi:hypothetical protein
MFTFSQHRWATGSRAVACCFSTSRRCPRCRSVPAFMAWKSTSSEGRISILATCVMRPLLLATRSATSATFRFHSLRACAILLRAFVFENFRLNNTVCFQQIRRGKLSSGSRGPGAGGAKQPLPRKFVVVPGGDNLDARTAGVAVFGSRVDGWDEFESIRSLDHDIDVTIDLKSTTFDDNNVETKDVESTNDVSCFIAKVWRNQNKVVYDREPTSLLVF